MAIDPIIRERVFINIIASFYDIVLTCGKMHSQYPAVVCIYKDITSILLIFAPLGRDAGVDFDWMDAAWNKKAS